MSELPVRPSRVDFEKVDLNQIQRILSTGTLDSLRPEEREYFSLMEMVRGLRARMRFTNGRMVTKAGIIRLLKARALLKLAGEYRRCFRKEQAEIPEELLNQKKVDIYTASREDLGVPAIDRKELEGFIDSIPEIPVAVRDNLKEDARIRKFDLKKRMIYDIEEFSEEDSE